jgi:gliding motility-associated-like protein
LPADGSIQLLPAGGSLPYHYSWSNRYSAQSQQGLPPGNYFVTVSDANNCTADTSFTLAYTYDFKVAASPVATIEQGDSITLNYVLTGTAGNYTATWQPAATLSCADCASPIATPVITTTYAIEIVNAAGCTAYDSIAITVIPDYNIYIPNVFSPNGDGNNDWFEVFGKKQTWKFFEVGIFNRWGEKVYEANDLNFKWDGSFKGAILPMGVYIYQLKVGFMDNHSEKFFKGSVTLIR